MKKIVGIIAAAALATSAFADVNFGLGANQAFAPVAYDGDDVVTVGPSACWSGDKPGRVGLSFNASSENAGISGDIHLEKTWSGKAKDDGTYDSYHIFGDNAYGWVKPFSFLEIKAGKIDTNWRRLGFGYGAWNTKRPDGIDGSGDDLAFYRPHSPNFALMLTPVEGLEIVWDYASEDGNKYYDELWNHARYGVSYTIADVGTIMAQVYGQDNALKDGDSTKWGVIGAAFQLTGVENLDAQFGVQVPTSFAPLKKLDGSDGVGNSAIKFGAGANYKIDIITLHAFFNGQMTSDNAKDYNKFGFALGGGADFNITDAYTLVADVRYINDWFNVTSGKAGDDHVIFYGGIEHHLTNANLRLGFEGATKSKINGHEKDGKAPDFTFAVPLVLDINF